jgi:hypothetical protein
MNFGVSLKATSLVIPPHLISPEDLCDGRRGQSGLRNE